jgi:cysteine-rich repeat protein
MSPGEACDDGNMTAGDGCSACALEPHGAGDTCPGEPVALGLGTTIVQGTTYGYADDLASVPYMSGGCGYVNGGADHVYAVTPAVDGILTATVGVLADGVTSACADPYAALCWDAAVYVRAACADQASEIACSDAGAFGPESVTVSVSAGVPVFVTVDGYDGEWWSAGGYYLALTLE